MERSEEIVYDDILGELGFFESLMNEQKDDFKNTEYHQAVLDEINAVKEILTNSKTGALREYFKEVVHRREQNFLKRGYDLREEFKHDSAEDILSQYKQQNIPEPTYQTVVGKIGKHTKWQAPALELSPGQGKFTHALCANDPLYVVDKHPEILEYVRGKFSKAYQRRLRVYEMKIPGDLSMLPYDQFGMIFSWGFFEKLPMDDIKMYLREFYRLLRPGGVGMLSYNNCQYKPSLQLTSTNTRAYNTIEYMTNLVRSLGFDNITSTNLEPNFTLLEFSKPGEFSSQRGSQTLGEIKEKLN